MRGGRVPVLLVPALIVAFVFSAGTDAAALRQEEFTVAPGAPTSEEYPPVPASDPNPFLTQPGQCDNAPSCHTIPLVVKQPNIGPNDDFYVRLTLSWDDQRVEDTQGNDLSIRLWEKDVEIVRSQTRREPEVMLVYRPTGKDYALTVINHRGVNAGFQLKGEVLTESIPPPFSFQDVDGPQPSGGSFAPPDARERPASAPPRPGSLPSAGSRSFASPGRDPSFAELAQASGQLDRFLGSPSELLGISDPRSRPPDPVSGLELALWAGLGPGVVLAAAAIWITRRRSKAEVL